MKEKIPSCSVRPVAWAIGFLLLATLLLSTALAAMGLRRPAVVVAPGVRDSQIALPDQIPDAAARKFALLYLSYFDTYSPLTVEDHSNYILRFVDPEHLEGVTNSLQERATYVVRAKESSQIILPRPEACLVERRSGGLLRVSLVAARRTFIAGNLKTEGPVRYIVDLRPALPTDEDAFGFVVVGQAIRPEEEKPPDDRARKGDSSDGHP